MARNSKKNEDKIRVLEARARKRRRDASQLTPDLTGPFSTSLDSLQDHDSSGPHNVRVDPDEEAKQAYRIVRFGTGRSFWEVGEYERAADSFRRVLKLDHGDPSFSRSAGRSPRRKHGRP